MSGIYIPGLKDLSCDECFWGIGSRLGCHATPEAVTRKINGRAADCPLIFLGDHGRLADADALFKKIGMDGNFGILEAMYIQSIIHDAPTIIPADEEAESEQ